MSPQKVVASAGPFTRIVDTLDTPYIDSTKILQHGVNGYIRTQADGSNWFARPGFALTNLSTPMAGARMQGACTYIDPTSNTAYRFFAINGVLYRSNDTFTTFTNVTPGGVTISSLPQHVTFTPVGNALVVNDSINRPWVMSNFGGTPVTGAYIDIDGAGTSWTALGIPTVYEDSVFFIVQTLNVITTVQPRVGIVWCEPNQPTVGYTQTGYADFWNIVENGSDPITAILGTNSGLFYWRGYSIGVLAGTPSLNFSTTATRDARSMSVGTFSPFSLALYGNTVFFVDALARPWSMALDGAPVPIWKQMYGVQGITYSPEIPALIGVGVVVPELNLYVVWPIGTYGVVFDADTGAYGGTWSVGPGVAADVLTVMRDATNNAVLCLCGGNSIFASGGYVWILHFLIDNVWTDTGGFLNPPSITTQPIGYSADQEMHPDRVVLIGPSSDTLTVVANTSYNNAVASVSVPPIASPASGTTLMNRFVMAMDNAATRFLSLTVTAPTSPTQQFGVQRIEVYGTRELAVLDP